MTSSAKELKKNILEANEVKFYLLEFCNLGDLKSAAEELNDDEKWDAVCQLNKALSKLHKKGMIVRDLKSNNIFVIRNESWCRTVTYVYKFGDLGSARSLPKRRRALDRQMTFYGHSNWYAGETALKSYTGTVDIFLLGRLIYQLFADEVQQMFLIIQENDSKKDIRVTNDGSAHSRLAEAIYHRLSEHSPDVSYLRAASQLQFFCEAGISMNIMCPEGCTLTEEEKSLEFCPKCAKIRAVNCVGWKGKGLKTKLVPIIQESRLKESVRQAEEVARRRPDTTTFGKTLEHIMKAVKADRADECVEDLIKKINNTPRGKWKRRRLRRRLRAQLCD